MNIQDQNIDFNSREFNTLSERERDMLLMKSEGHDYNHIAEKFNLSNTRVKQIIDTSLRKYKRLCQAREYSNILDVPVRYSKMPVRIRNYACRYSEKDNFTLGELKESIETGRINKARNIGRAAIAEAIAVFEKEYRIKVKAPKTKLKIKIELECEGGEEINISNIDDVLSYLSSIKDNNPDMVKGISVVKSD